MSHDWPQYKLRMPPDLKAMIDKSAKENNRSINAEIVSRLEVSIIAETPSDTLISARDALKLAQSSITTSRATLTDLVMEDINDATRIGGTECTVLLPGSFYDRDDKISTKSDTYIEIIIPVINAFVDLGYCIYLNEETSMLNVSWDK